jgi:hypothetical protein
LIATPVHGAKYPYLLSARIFGLFDAAFLRKIKSSRLSKMMRTATDSFLSDAPWRKRVVKSLAWLAFQRESNYVKQASANPFYF